ncbi:MAG: DUF1289 domain-containing protein [Pseudomonadota bacterium]
MQNRDERPLSPCILICTLDDQQRCIGCGRSLDQVRRWSAMSVAEQWAVIDELAAHQPPNGDTIAPDCGD